MADSPYQAAYAAFLEVIDDGREALTFAEEEAIAAAIHAYIKAKQNSDDFE